jgi:hypothetical protein
MTVRMINSANCLRPRWNSVSGGAVELRGDVAESRGAAGRDDDRSGGAAHDRGAEQRHRARLGEGRRAARTDDGVLLDGQRLTRQGGLLNVEIAYGQ